MGEITLPRLRVKALQPRRFRAGLEFTAEPRDLTPDTIGVLLGGGFMAVVALAAILADPLLSVTVVETSDDGETERPVTDDERTALGAFLEAEDNRVDPGAPPTPDAAEAAAQAETERLAAEAAAQAETERLAAEAAAQTETERLAAEAAAQAETERLAAEAAAPPSGRKKAKA